MIEKLEEMGSTTSNSGLGCGVPDHPQSESVLFSVRTSMSFAAFGRMRKSSLAVASKEPSAPIANTATGQLVNKSLISHATIARDEMNLYKAEKALEWSDEMFSDEWLLCWWTVCTNQTKFLRSTTHDAHRRSSTNILLYSKLF